MINCPIAQTQNQRCLCQPSSPTSWNCRPLLSGTEGTRWLICKQAISTPSLRPAIRTFSSQATPPTLPPLCASPLDHDVMAHDIISFGTANLLFPFFATEWTFINSDRITSGKGCTGTGLGHTQWVGKCRHGTFGEEKKVLLFQSRLNITIIKLQS